jgi:signal transduction histidine kinase
MIGLTIIVVVQAIVLLRLTTKLRAVTEDVEALVEIAVMKIIKPEMDKELVDIKNKVNELKKKIVADVSDKHKDKIRAQRLNKKGGKKVK